MRRFLISNTFSRMFYGKMIIPILWLSLFSITILLYQSLKVAFPTNDTNNQWDTYMDTTMPSQMDVPSRKMKKSSSRNMPQQQQQQQLITKQRPYEPNPRPKLNRIISGWNVTGNPQWLLNFAISGFPKCGTSTLMHYFANNPEIHIHRDERCDLGYNQQVQLIRDLYQNFPSGDYIRGIKCPRDLENKLSLANYQRFFPDTDMIIGLRHPILWFESFYNHRIQNQFEMPHNLSSLIGACSKGTHGVCTNRAGFHVNLAMLGKTRPLKSPEERKWMPTFGIRYLTKFAVRLTGRIFLYEMEQLRDTGPQFRGDLQQFLKLKNPLPPIPWFRPGRQQQQSLTTTETSIISDTRKTSTATSTNTTFSRTKMNICDDQYIKLRSILMRHARNASYWIRTYFLMAPDVTVSSPDWFVQRLESWNQDPCEIRNNSAETHIINSNTTVMNCTDYGCFLATKSPSP